MSTSSSSSVAGDVRLMQSEPIKEDKISKSYVVAESRMVMVLRERRRQKNGRDIDPRRVGPSLYRTEGSKKHHSHRSIIGATPFEAAGVSELEFSSPKSLGKREYNFNVVRWTIPRKKVSGTLAMPLRKRVLRVDECTTVESASLSSLLKQFQSQ